MCEDAPCCGCCGNEFGSPEADEFFFPSAEVESDFEPEENDEPGDMTDVEADADTLASAGYGTDEDYGYFGENEE